MELIDIWRAAQQMIKMYEGEAGFIAAQRADALFEQGDIDGFHAWVHIMNAIKDIQNVGEEIGGLRH